MDQRLRLVIAAAVMLSGLGVALLFRRPFAQSDVPIAVQSDPLVLRKQPDPRTLAAGESSSGTLQPRPLPAAPIEPRRVPPTIVSPAEQPAPPPELSKTYPSSGPRGTPGQAASTRWGSSMREMLPDPERSLASAPPTHKVIDGDTLELLAERYLGSASRAMEIYEANRDVPYLTPKILPMGAELKIPRADQAANSAP